MRILLALVLVAASLACSLESFDRVRPQIEALRMENGVASVTVAVARDGKIIWEDGFGWADREKRVPATDTRCTPWPRFPNPSQPPV